MASELNVEKLTFVKNSKVKLDTKITPALKRKGEAREIIRQIQQARKEAECDLAEKVTVELPQWPKEYEDQIKRETLAKSLIKARELKIVRSR